MQAGLHFVNFTLPGGPEELAPRGDRQGGRRGRRLVLFSDGWEGPYLASSRLTSWTMKPLPSGSLKARNDP